MARTIAFCILTMALFVLSAHGQVNTSDLPKATARSSRDPLSIANGVTPMQGAASNVPGFTTITSCTGIDDSTAINALVMAAKGGMVVIMPGETCAANDITIPNLRIMKGGLLKPVTSHSVTISGVFDAGPYQVFTGSGTVLFAPGAVDTVYANWFGNCATELGAPLNKAIRSIATIGGHIQLPSGPLTQTVSVNLTNIHNQSIKISGSLRGTIINAQLTGVAFDCTGSQFLEFRDFTISGNGSITPAVGFLFARNSTHDSAGRNHMYNVGTMGYFRVAALYNYASEEFRAYDYYFTNSTNGKPVVVVTRDNVANVASAYATIDSGSQSTLDIHFVGGAINNYATSGDSDCVLIRGASGIGFTNALFVNNARAFVHIDAATYSATNIDFKNITFDGNGTATYGFYVTGSKEIAYLGVDNLLDYGIKAPGKGGRTFYADNGTSLSSLSLKRLYAPAGLYVYTDSVIYSDIDVGAAGTFENHYYISNSIIRIASNKLILVRPDLSLKNTIFYIDTGSLGLTLPVYANNAAAVAGGLPVGAFYRTGGDPDQVCIVH